MLLLLILLLLEWRCTFCCVFIFFIANFLGEELVDSNDFPTWYEVLLFLCFCRSMVWSTKSQFLLNIELLWRGGFVSLIFELPKFNVSTMYFRTIIAVRLSKLTFLSFNQFCLFPSKSFSVVISYGYLWVCIDLFTKTFEVLFHWFYLAISNSLLKDIASKISFVVPLNHYYISQEYWLEAALSRCCFLTFGISLRNLILFHFRWMWIYSKIRFFSWTNKWDEYLR